MTDRDEQTKPDTRVLYNAACPVCRLEIDHYAAYAIRHALPLRFDDLNSDARAVWSVSADQAARRLHVLRGNNMLSGIPAFLALWEEMPRYRWLAKIVGLPGIRQSACLIYDHALAPLLYRTHLRRQARRKALS